MRCTHEMLLVAIAVAGLTGCQGSNDEGESAPPDASAQVAPAESSSGAQTAAGAPNMPEPTVPNDTSSPGAAAAVFLDAVRRGDDARILEMYTVRAREEAAKLNEHFAPRGSDTAQFEVGEVEKLADDAARVACRWSDLDQNGQRHTMEFLWTMRRESEGWRVAGMVATPFPGENPVLLDFENLDETIEKVNRLAENIRQRDAAAAGEATTAKKSPDPVQR